MATEPNGKRTMRTELEDLREHLERYRAVTLQVLDLVSDECRFGAAALGDRRGGCELEER